MQTLAQYAALINATLALTILGTLVGLAVFWREGEKKRAEVIEERLKAALEDHGRLKEWSEREKTELTAKNEKLRVELEEALSKSGFTIATLAGGASLEAHGKEARATVERLRTSLEEVQNEVNSVDPETDLEIAKAHMAQGNWRAAAERLDRYVESNPDSFEVQFLRGVAWANTREANVPALRAYNEAVALVPTGSPDLESVRPFVYRGAVLKRLGRLKEAQNDLSLALDRLQGADAYEADDARYNLACIAAMEGDKVTMMRHLRSIRRVPEYQLAVCGHLKDYFERFAHDSELIVWLELDLDDRE